MKWGKNEILIEMKTETKFDLALPIIVANAILSCSFMTISFLWKSETSLKRFRNSKMVRNHLGAEIYRLYNLDG